MYLHSQDCIATDVYVSNKTFLNEIWPIDIQIALEFKQSQNGKDRSLSIQMCSILKWQVQKPGQTLVATLS